MSKASSSFPPSSSSVQPQGVLHMDSAILSIAHSPPKAMDATAGGISDLPLEPGTQRKITLLTRPPQQTGAGAFGGVGPSLPSSTLPPSVLTPSLSTNPLKSELASSSAVVGVVGSSLNVASLPYIPSSTATIPSLSGGTTRAARNDYYDTEDPSVNLHEFIINSMQSQKNRVVLLQLEDEFFSYISDPNRTEPLRLPPWDSYHRMLAHRVAAYFGLEHNVDALDKTCVVVCKGPNTRLPQLRFTQYLPAAEETEAEPKLILKRAPRESSDKFDSLLVNATAAEVKSFEEREEEYEKARARIFSQQPTSQSSRSSFSFDLGSPPQPSSIFPPLMHHRRTVSDTMSTLLSRPSAEAKKEGPSSSHSSRSATPLLATLLRDFQLSLQSQASSSAPAPPPSSSSASCLPSQQPVLLPEAVETTLSPPQKQSSPSQQPSQAYHRQQVGGGSGKRLRQRPNSMSSSLQFQPVQGLPVVYHPSGMVPAAATADPSWGYYNNMLLYQVSPQPYLAATQYPQMLPQQALYQPYSTMAPGVIGQPTVLSPPARQAQTVRLPAGQHPTAAAMLEPMTSPLGLGGGATTVPLVRPIPQQASSAGVKAVEGQWTSPGAPALVSPGATQGGNGQAAFALVPVEGAGQLADQMEQSLSLGARDTSSQSLEHEQALAAEKQASLYAMGQMAAAAAQYSPVSHKAYQLHAAQMHASQMHAQVMSAAAGMPASPGGTAMALRRNGAPANGGVPAGAALYPMMTGLEMLSPTQVQFLPAHMHPHLIPGSPDGTGMSPGLVQYHAPSPSPATPSTPPLPPHTILPAHQHPGILSPPSSGGVVQSPIQVLGHTLGTSLFSPPPPSTSAQAHALFVNSPTSTGKIVGYTGGPSSHPPVGTAPRFRRYESPKSGPIPDVVNSMPAQNPAHSTGGALSQTQLAQESPTSQHRQLGKPSVNGGGVATQPPGSPVFQPLPPRLAPQPQHRGTGTRYQNQRHPANRGVSVVTKGVTLGDHMPTQFLPVGGVSPSSAKREPLLPTPPSTQMIKLDTSLTCGVPLNVMEVLSPPAEGSSEQQQMFQALREMGALDFSCGYMPRQGEAVTIAVFPTPEIAIQALHTKHPLCTLSIPRKNHAKFILSLLQPPPPLQPSQLSQ